MESFGKWKYTTDINEIPESINKAIEKMRGNILQKENFISCSWLKGLFDSKRYIIVMTTALIYGDGSITGMINRENIASIGDNENITVIDQLNTQKKIISMDLNIKEDILKKISEDITKNYFKPQIFS